MSLFSTRVAVVYMWIFVFCLVICSVPVVTAAENSPPATALEPEVITLPSYNVKTERLFPPMKKWRYVSVPGYEILTDLSDHNTKVFVDDFYRLQEVAQIIMPGTEAANPAPTYVVLCDSRKDFEHFLPKKQFEAAQGKRTEFDPIKSTFVNDSERSAIVVDFSYREKDPESDFLNVNEPFKAFYLEFFRQRLRQSLNSPPPIWLEEGLVQIYADVDFNQERIFLGKIEQAANLAPSSSAATTGRQQMTRGSQQPDQFSFVAQGGRVAAFPWIGSGLTGMRSLLHQSIMPLETFFNWDQLSRDERTRVAGAFGAQAYLFSHFCIYGRGHRHQSAYYKLAEYAAKAPITEEVFKKFFGLTFKKMELEMRGYLDYTDYEMVKFRIKNGGFDTPPAVALREATDAESGRIAGEFLRLAGHRDESLNQLIAPYVRGARDAELLAALGLAELQAGHTERARRFLETASTNKTVRVRALLELGKLRLAEAKTKAAVENRSLNKSEIGFVQDPLLRATSCPPPMRELFGTLAQLWYENDVALSQQEFKTILIGAVEFERDLRLVYLVAAVGIKQGYAEESRRLVSAGLANSPNAETKKAFADLAAKLPPGRDGK